ncbi:hypothetical protein [Thermococcus sp.]
MSRGQSNIEYLIMIAVVLVLLALVLNYTYSASRGFSITGVAYIDPELSPEKPGYNHPVNWIVYRYPPKCNAGTTCEFYVSVNLHYYPDRGKYRVWVYVNGDSKEIKTVVVRLCNGVQEEWNFPEDAGKNKIRGIHLEESDFPCVVYITARRR